MNRILKRASLALNGSKSKVAAGVAVVVASTNSAFAAVAFDTATGQFTGSMDMDSFYSAAGIVAVAVGVVIAVSLGIKTLKKAG